MTHTITLKELEAQYTGTYSVRDNSPRGRKEVSFYNLKVGDEVLIDNYFTTIIEEPVEEPVEDTAKEVIEEPVEVEKIEMYSSYDFNMNVRRNFSSFKEVKTYYNKNFKSYKEAKKYLEFLDISLIKY